MLFIRKGIFSEQPMPAQTLWASVLHAAQRWWQCVFSCDICTSAVARATCHVLPVLGLLCQQSDAGPRLSLQHNQIWHSASDISKVKAASFSARGPIISSFTLKSQRHSRSVSYDPCCSKQINHTDWHVCRRAVQRVVKRCQEVQQWSPIAMHDFFTPIDSPFMRFTVIATASAQGPVDWSCDILILWSIHVNGTSW